MILTNKENFTKFRKQLLAPVILALVGLACSLFGASSPTAVYQAFTDAAKKKDPAAMKKYLSAAMMKDLKSIAQSSGKSEDELLTSFSDGDEPVEMTNEKIDADGQTASLDVKTKSDKTQTIYFVKEDGWKIASDKPKSKDTTKDASIDSTKGPDSSSSPSEPADTSPLTISADSLVADAMNSSTAMDKYRGRILTVTDAELWEIQYGMLHIGTRYGSYYSGYIICSGSFSQYEPYKDKIAELKRQGKAPGATIKGTFSKVVTDSGYTQVHLDPCVLSNLEKP
jgi:hypothetical protein